MTSRWRYKRRIVVTRPTRRIKDLDDRIPGCISGSEDSDMHALFVIATLDHRICNAPPQVGPICYNAVDHESVSFTNTDRNLVGNRYGNKFLLKPGRPV